MATSFNGWGTSWGNSWGTGDPNAMYGSASFSFNAFLQVADGDMGGSASFRISASLQVSQGELPNEVVLRPKKWYLKRGKQYLIFDTAEEADAYEEAEKAIQQAQKTSRRARKRVREKVYSAVAQPEVIDTSELTKLVDRLDLGFDLAPLIAQQNIEELVRIALLAQQMQDEEEIEMLLLL